MGEGRRFHLLRQLGAGGHGEVYLAEQESQAGFRRRVALKVLRADLGHNDQAARRMRDEARILGRLSHRHIVGVSDLVRLGNRWAVVMDYVPGADLDQVLETLTRTEQTFPPKAAIEAAIAVLRALHAAWTVDNGDGAPLKLIHRDIKPSNVLLAEDGALKVLDFGVARVDLGTREAETGAVRPGTLRYMAPERLLGEEETPAGDIYATAVSIMELLVGEPLGRTPIIDEKHQKYIDDAVQTASRLAPGHEGYAEALAALATAIAGDPEERPGASELEARLSAVVGTLPGEDLNTFAHRIIPVVSEVLGDKSEPMSGTLHEATSAGNLTLPEFSSATFGGSESRTAAPPAPTEHEPEPEEDSGGGIPWIGVAVGVAIAALLVCGLGGAGLAVAVGGGLGGAVVATPNPEPEDSDAVAPVDATDPDTEAPAAPAEDTDEGEADPVEDTDAGEAESGSASSRNTGSANGGSSGGTSARNPGGGSSNPRQGGSGGSGSSSGTTTETPEEPATIAPDAPRVSAAMFVMPEASSLEVTCGDVSRVGTASVRLRNLPAGNCSIRATYLDQKLTARVEVTSRREVRCAITDGSLACR